MSVGASLLFSSLIGYLFGAVPVGYLLVKARKGIDLRQFGSGRTGGTNAFRAGGLAVGVATSVFDVLKAACAVWSVQAIFGDTIAAKWLPWAEATAGVFSIIGHNWSAFIGWRGGAGTGPNVGWAGALWFPIVPIAIATVLIVLLGIGIASIATLAMAAAVPISFFVLYVAGVEPFDSSVAYIIGGLVSAGIILWSLRPNLRRLIAGNERVVGPRAGKSASKQSNADQERAE
jgi:glycerol-3-phosphate acyltransferase PlsY